MRFVIKSGIGEMTSLLRNITLFLYITKPYLIQSICRDLYAQFGYVPLKNFQHTQENVSGPMNDDPINMIHTSQLSTKEDLNEELDGYFRSINKTNWSKKVRTPNWHPRRNLWHTCGGVKSVCPVWIHPTYNFLTHLGKFFRIKWMLIWLMLKK